MADFGLVPPPAGTSLLNGNGRYLSTADVFGPALPSNASPFDVHVADLNSDGNLITSSNNNEVHVSAWGMAAGHSSRRPKPSVLSLPGMSSSSLSTATGFRTPHF